MFYSVAAVVGEVAKGLLKSASPLPNCTPYRGKCTGMPAWMKIYEILGGRVHPVGLEMGVSYVTSSTLSEVNFM